ncbi:hypothetical protein EB118_24215, partial [bacterium]|nr:hypothetical protein [bacterium]
MNQLLSIVDDALVIKKLSVQTLDGPVQATDDLKVDGNVFVNRDIKAKRNVDISGILTVDTLKVKNLVTENEKSSKTDPNKEFTFVAKGEKNLDGKGLIWLDGDTGAKQFVYKEGNILWSSMDIDLIKRSAYRINKQKVLTENELGSSVVRSNLRKVGELEGLKVSGQVEFDNWVFFNTVNNTVGINTENPSSTLGVVVENGIEVIIGSKGDKTAAIGTFTCNSLDIITDNKTRMSLRENGDIIFGNPKFSNAVLKVYGKLEVDEIITKETNKDKNLIVFKRNDGAPAYQTGLLWQHGSVTKQFLYTLNPDRLYTTEIMDLAEGKWFSIDNSMTLSKTTLGDSVTNSNIEKLGILRSLEVQGESKFHSAINADNINVSTLTNKDNFKIVVDNEEELVITANSNIIIGSVDNTN